MVRGGSFFNHQDNLRCAARNRNHPNDRNDNLGFRVVLSTFFGSLTPELPGGAKPFWAEEKNGGARSWPRPLAWAGHTSIVPPTWTRSPGGTLFGPHDLIAMYQELISWENLLAAYRQASRGKRSHTSVATFEHRLEDHLLDLHHRLRDRSYRPGDYNSFFIHEPKRRLISAAPFVDRVVHHALCNLIEPLFEPFFVAESFANRRGKGTHEALDQCQRLAQLHPWVLQIDVKQFFPSIDHQILHRIIARKVDDPDVLRLIELILESGAGVLDASYEMVYHPGDDLFAVLRPRGLPIGNLTSQFWANIYLDPLDHMIKRELRCPGYVRYVDDLLLFGDTKRQLWTWRQAVSGALARLRLTPHPGAHPRPVTEGIPFLGFVVYPHRRRVKRRKVIHFRRRLRAMLADLKSGTTTADRVAATIHGWLEHIRHGQSAGLRQALLSEVPHKVCERLKITTRKDNNR